MANQCLPQVQACRMRVTRLEGDGVPLPGANNVYVSNALVSLAAAWQVEAGDEITEKNACGETIVNFRGDDQLRRINITIKILTPDPQLSELLSGGSVLTAGAAVGYAAPSLGSVNSDAVSIELWKKQIGSNGRQDATFPWAWHVYPYVDHLRPDDHEHSNASFPMQFLGEGYENSNWFDGPANDFPAASTQCWQWIPTTDAHVPSAACGYQTLAAS